MVAIIDLMADGQVEAIRAMNVGRSYGLAKGEEGSPCWVIGLSEGCGLCAVWAGVRAVLDDYDN